MLSIYSKHLPSIAIIRGSDLSNWHDSENLARYLYVCDNDGTTRLVACVGTHYPSWRRKGSARNLPIPVVFPPVSACFLLQLPHTLISLSSCHLGKEHLTEDYPLVSPFSRKLPTPVSPRTPIP